MNVFDIVTGALLMVVAIVEVIGFAAAFKTNLKLATLYSRLTVPGLALVVACEILNIVGHHSFKDRIINDCTTRNTGEVAPSGGFGWFGQGSSGSVMSAADAQNYCNSQWKYDSTWEIVWLIITVLLGVPFVLFSLHSFVSFRIPRQ